jgi:diguanylate cyclase (GGDEF)-like protein
MPEELNDIILLIEDNLGTAELVCEKLGENWKNIFHVKSGKEARTWLEHNYPCLILLDFSLPDMTGAEFVQKTRDMPPFIVVTGAGNENTAVMMMKYGARDYLAKDAHFLENLPLVVEQVMREIATERRLAKTEEALRKYHENLDALIENIDGSIWSLDPQYNLIIGNEKFHRNTSAPLGRRLETGECVLLPGFPPEVNAEWQGYYERGLRGERFSIETMTRFRSVPDYVEYNFNPILSSNGSIVGVTVFGHDITERKKAEMKLEQANILLKDQLGEINELKDALRELSIRDPLTGVYNRRYMEESLNQEYARAFRKQSPISIVILDLDHLKEINDTYGHLIGGDKALQFLASQLHSMCRPEDVLCRYGGDEFLVILHDTPAHVAYERVMQWRENIINTKIEYQSGQFTITFSAGVAEFPTHGQSMEEVILAADTALYNAKDNGRDRIKLYDKK